MLTKIEGDQVSYADPHTGRLATTTKRALSHAESHPDGNFVFLPSSLAGFNTPLTEANYYDHQQQMTQRWVDRGSR